MPVNEFPEMSRLSSKIATGLGAALWLGSISLAQTSDLVELVKVDPSLRLDQQFHGVSALSRGAGLFAA